MHCANKQKKPPIVLTLSQKTGFHAEFKSPSLPNKLLIWWPCGVLTGGMHADYHSRQEFHAKFKFPPLLHKLLIWRPCGAVLTGGMHHTPMTVWSKQGHLYLFFVFPTNALLHQNFFHTGIQLSGNSVLSNTICIQLQEKLYCLNNKLKYSCQIIAM